MGVLTDIGDEILVEELTTPSPEGAWEVGLTARDYTATYRAKLHARGLCLPSDLAVELTTALTAAGYDEPLTNNPEPLGPYLRAPYIMVWSDRFKPCGYLIVHCLPEGYEINEDLEGAYPGGWWVRYGTAQELLDSLDCRFPAP